ncbi:MAG: proline--tRNA ligase [Puniceicoccales bacterium]|jgi:prolyl-tRNA synthetase|nr:proline--tRNA ligase [Puniceicoccales bacterium]
MKATKHAISPTRNENYAEWYQQVVRAADLAENSSVRGCMVIKPWGYAIWEILQRELDKRIKETGHSNAYFPLFIPKSYLEREAAHVEGFAKECAVVTHSRLVQNEKGELIPASPLEEPLVVRPTSEVIIGESFARWIKSYRDLPLLINQWANVVRWEMRPRIFLRTTEFLWQEGHTAHATPEEAEEETRKMLEVYRTVAEKLMALPVIPGKKTAAERFPGAVETFSIEAMMQDGKALQAGTSHFLGQNFSRACGIKFIDKEGEEQFAWTSSWGVSTRLIGGLIMAHSDDDGLLLPPRLAPIQVVVLPVLRGEKEDASVLASGAELCHVLGQKCHGGEPLRVSFDDRDRRGGEKNWEHIKKGVPLRVELGTRDIAIGQVTFLLRDGGGKQSMAREEFVEAVPRLLGELQERIFAAALALRRERTIRVKNFDEFREFFSSGNGFVEAHFCGDGAIERRMREEFSVTARCIPLETEGNIGPCFADPSRQGPITLWARAY